MWCNSALVQPAKSETRLPASSRVELVAGGLGGWARGVGRWLAARQLVLSTELIAALPIIVATIYAIKDGWVPLGYFLVAVLAPYVTLLAVSVSRSWGLEFWQNLTLAHYRFILFESSASTRAIRPDTPSVRNSEGVNLVDQRPH